VLVGLGRREEALLVAERGRTRAFVDLLLERQGSGNSGSATGQRSGNRVDDSVPTSVDQLVEIVNRQKASVLYYSLAAGSLYSWFIVPTKGTESDCSTLSLILVQG
jgi:hypothetical protein